MCERFRDVFENEFTSQLTLSNWYSETSMDRLNKPNSLKIAEVVNQDPKLVLQMVSFSSLAVAQTDSERRLNLQKKHFYLLLFKSYESNLFRSNRETQHS